MVSSCLYSYHSSNGCRSIGQEKMADGRCTALCEIRAQRDLHFSRSPLTAAAAASREVISELRRFLAACSRRRRACSCEPCLNVPRKRHVIRISQAMGRRERVALWKEEGATRRTSKESRARWASVAPPRRQASHFRFPPAFLPSFARLRGRPKPQQGALKCCAIGQDLGADSLYSKGNS